MLSWRLPPFQAPENAFTCLSKLETIMIKRFILALACVCMTGAGAYAADTSFSVSGKWDSDFGLTELSEQGTKVTGSYATENGRILGTRSGNRLTGKWIQSNASRRCETAVNGSHFHGQFVFEFTANQFVGKWGYCDDIPMDRWLGTRNLASTAKTQSQESMTAANAGGAVSSQSGSRPAPCPQCPSWVSHSFSGSYLPLSAQANIWSNPKPFNRASGQMTVQSRFTRQKGTTCEFDVQFNNVGSNSIDEGVIVNRPGKAAVSAYDHVIRIRLKPGASYAFGTEVRECPLNWGETKDMTKCASCEPIVYFVDQ
jgi:hypothetical protein